MIALSIIIASILIYGGLNEIACAIKNKRTLNDKSIL